jgi:hypothetical protein
MRFWRKNPIYTEGVISVPIFVSLLQACED